MSAAALLQVDSVTLRYRTHDAEVTATDAVSFALARGERLVLLGPSGCGKSSLLKAVGGFIAPVAGRISLDGRPVAGPGPERMMVFQEFDQLLPWKTVLDNVAFPLRASGKCPNAAEARARARPYVDKVGLGRFADAYPHTLSGGMKQRVAIARALAQEPAILLMDEPFAALDALTRRNLQAELLRLWEELHFTLMFVTHAIDEAVRIGQRIVLLSAHPGRVRREFEPALAGEGLQAEIEGLLLDEKLVSGAGI